MPSMPRPAGAALAERLGVLDAERLAPVPRPTHTVAVDATDLALVLEHLRALTRHRALVLPAAGPDVAAARDRLDAASRPHLNAAASGRAAR